MKIPIQLQDPKFRFIKVKAKSKDPIEKKWTTKNNYQYKDEELQEHIKGGGSYGVACGYGDLLGLDADDKRIIDIIEDKLPKTFTVKTRHGFHYYYICSNVINGVLENEKKENIGHIQFKGKQLIGVGCMHETGFIYEVVKDVPIAKVTYEDVKKYLGKYIIQEKKKKVKTEAREETDSIIVEIKKKINLKDVMKYYGMDLSKNPTKCLFHTSKGEKSFSYDDDVWNCFNCDRSGNMFYLVMEMEKCSFAKAKLTLMFLGGIKNKVEVKELKDGELKQIHLPQEDKVLVSEFAKEVSEPLKDKDIFYRMADKNIVEMRKNELKVVAPTRLINIIENVCVPVIERWNKNHIQEFHKKTPSEQVCKILLSSDFIIDKLRIIERTLNVPIPILKDGRLTFPKYYYNSDLKLYVNKTGAEISNPDMPLEEAKNLISDIYKEFCVKNELDFYRGILSLLTPFCRGLYNVWNTRTPLFIFFANMQGAGKDYMAGIRTIVFEGKVIEDPPVSKSGKGGNDDDELRKKALGTLMAGNQFLHFSNNKGIINLAVLEYLITAQNIEDRVLGKNEMVVFENNLEFSLSGNIGTMITPDLMRRSIIINLFWEAETPNEREFVRPDLHEYIKENRSKILSALYSLVRNWYDKGMPKSKALFSAFPEWASVCGGILECAGYKNPMAFKTIDVKLDRELEDMKSLFQFINEVVGEEWLSRSDVRQKVIDDTEWNIFTYLNLEEMKGQVRFGLLLNKYEGRTLGDITLLTETTQKTKSRQKIMFKKDAETKRFNLKEFLERQK